MCFHQHLDFFLCVLCCVMFGQGDNVFCFVAADAYGVHMRIALNFLRKCLEQEVATALHSNDRKNQDLSIKTQYPAVPSAITKYRHPQR